MINTCTWVKLQISMVPYMFEPLKFNYMQKVLYINKVKESISGSVILSYWLSVGVHIIIFLKYMYLEKKNETVLIHDKDYFVLVLIYYTKLSIWTCRHRPDTAFCHCRMWSDQSLHCLPIVRQILDIPAGRKVNMFKLHDQYLWEVFDGVMVIKYLE